jgi:coenzyme F420 hydrogenase subunit beta
MRKPRHHKLDNWGGLGGAYDTKVYPAKDLCSHCGLCDTRYITYVKESCAFLNQHITELEEKVHGRGRDMQNEDELYFGVFKKMLVARKRRPIVGAQWTGIVSSLAIAMLEAGLVEGVVCVQNSKHDRFSPQPIIARSRDEILAAKVNKPTLSPNLSVLDAVERSGMKKLLFVGVGCQVEALRSVQDKIGLEKLYVLGTPCVDNVTRAGLQKFLETTSSSPETVVYYEFMQDFRVHFKHDDSVIGGPGRKWEEIVPFFALDTKELKDVFAPSCLSCFDYVNSLADLVVGYMGAPFGWQWIVARNDAGLEMLELARDLCGLEEAPVTSRGDRRNAVQQSIPAYDQALTLPRWIAEIIAVIIDKIGPKGLEYARFSIDSHFTRNYLYVRRKHPEKLEAHVPEYAKRIVAQYRLPEK